MVFYETHTSKGSRIQHPGGGGGVKMRIDPPYPRVRRERRLKWGGFSEVGPVSVLWQARKRTLRNVYGVGTRP